MWAYQSDSTLPDVNHKHKPRVVVTTLITNTDNAITQHGDSN